MRVMEAKLHFIFEMENINDGSKLVFHAQCLVPYPSTLRGEQASVDRREEAKHCDTSYYPENAVLGVRKRNLEYELLGKRPGFCAGNDDA